MRDLLNIGGIPNPVIRASAYKFLTKHDLSAVVVVPSGLASLLCQRQGGGFALK